MRAGADPYLSSGLIAYIGNKRSHLEFIHEALAPSAARGRAPLMLDPFAGSGVVARLGKRLGFRVEACDREAYAALLTGAAISIGPAEAGGLFGGAGGLEALLRELNSMHPGRGGRPARRDANSFMALHYAPERTQGADPRRERLFYTAENAAFLDRARDWIEREYRGVALDLASARSKEKALLLAALLYEASVHSNTSGVFKAFHNGYGGHSGDALGRIMAPMELEAPALVEGEPCSASRMDAAEFCASRPAEIAYLDPPYNQHQYGSNYHILNTLLEWGKEAPPAYAAGAGRGRENKSGIPAAWKGTKSGFCSRATVAECFERLYRAIDARRIVLSYGDSGIYPFDELCSFLASQGELRVAEKVAVNYRGGRRSDSNSVRSSEFLLVVERGPRGGGKIGAAPPRVDARGGAAQVEGLGAFKARRVLAAALAGVHDPAKIGGEFRFVGDDLLFGGARLGMLGRAVFDPGIDAAALFPQLGEAGAKELASRLRRCAAGGRAEEGAILLAAYAASADARLKRLFLRCLRSVCHRKHESAFRALFVAAKASPAVGLGEAIGAIEGLATKRGLRLGA